MIRPQRWILVAALLTAVGGMALVLSDQEQFSPGGGGTVLAAVPGAATATTTQVMSDGAFAVHLPFVGVKFGSRPPLFGIQMYGRLSDSTGLDKVVEAGARWVRVPISWASIEPDNRTPDAYNWSGVDRQVNALVDAGIEPFVTVTGNPVWAAEYAQGPVHNLADLQELMGALVERYDADGYQDAPGSPRVTYWELYNEPDNVDEWHASHGGYGLFGYQGDVYAAHLDAVYDVVKAANPNVQLVFGGIASDNFDYEGGYFDPNFLPDVLSNCRTRCFDLMNFHYFPLYRHRYEPFGKDLIGKTNWIRSVLQRYGFDRPIVCSETTWPSASQWGNDDLQARYVASAYVRAMAAGLKLLNWYAWKDADTTLPGLLDDTLAPKPAYYAYRTTAGLLARAKFLRPLQSAEVGATSIEGYVFSVPRADGADRVDVVWYDCPGYALGPPTDCAAGTYEDIAISATVIEVMDLDGNTGIWYDEKDGIVDGKIVVPVGLRPLFIRYIAASGTAMENPHLGQEPVEPSPSGSPVSTEAESYANCRFGMGVTGVITRYQAAPLNLGWYLNWSSQSSPVIPGALEYVQTMRLQQSGTAGWQLVSPAPALLTQTVQMNPGALWLVGNEPDSPWQDDMLPEVYAHAYHDLYQKVKTLDPTARIGIGGLVQPTPLRFAYLDQVWETYQQAFGEELPVDVWSMHSFILRETTTQPEPDPCGGPDILWDWGADVPPGSDAEHGELYCVRDQDNLEIFWQRIRDLRQWMADRGQREKPLYITEYGVLFPEDYYDEDGRRLDQARVGRFMTGTFDRMLNGTDASIGYPPDGNRLVQRWAWFSLDANPFLWGGTLFDPDTHEIRPLGETFRDYTTAISPQADLMVVKAHPSLPVYLMEGVPVTASLRAEISNIGNISATLPVEVTFFDGPPHDPGSQVIGTAALENGLEGCGDYGAVEVDWPELDVGVHRFFVTVSEIDGEPVENNQADGVAVVLTDVIYLPFAFGPR